MDILLNVLTSKHAILLSLVVHIFIIGLFLKTALLLNLFQSIQVIFKAYPYSDLLSSTPSFILTGADDCTLHNIPVKSGKALSYELNHMHRFLTDLLSQSLSYLISFNNSKTQSC